MEDAVERIRKFVVQLFMRDDGEGVDWSSPIIAEALLKLAFQAIDRVPRGPRVYSLLRRIEMGVYNRMTVLVTESYAECRPSAVRARVGAGRAGGAFQRRGAIGRAGAAYCCFAACSSRSR